MLANGGKRPLKEIMYISTIIHIHPTITPRYLCMGDQRQGWENEQRRGGKIDVERRRVLYTRNRRSFRTQNLSCYLLEIIVVHRGSLEGWAIVVRSSHVLDYWTFGIFTGRTPYLHVESHVLKSLHGSTLPYLDRWDANPRQ